MSLAFRLTLIINHYELLDTKKTWELYNQATTKLAFYSNVTSKDKLTMI